MIDFEEMETQYKQFVKDKQKAIEQARKIHDDNEQPANK